MESRTNILLLQFLAGLTTRAGVPPSGTVQKPHQHHAIVVPSLFSLSSSLAGSLLTDFKHKIVFVCWWW